LPKHNLGKSLHLHDLPWQSTSAFSTRCPPSRAEVKKLTKRKLVTDSHKAA